MIFVKSESQWLVDWVVAVKGCGDLGTGVVYRLQRAGLRVIATELACPVVIRRKVALATAVYEGVVDIEGVIGRRIEEDREIGLCWQDGEIPVLVDPEAAVVSRLHPVVIVDAIMAKRNLGTTITDAPIVIALGPGFEAGRDVHAVIETQRGHFLGRVIYKGAAAPSSGVPGSTKGVTEKRVLRAPTAGRFQGVCQIGERVRAGQVVAQVNDELVRAEIDGVVRGLLADGLQVRAGLKVGDVDPRGVVEYCFHISDKALAVGGGVLEAVLFLGRKKGLL
jgi:xanthine dehydrogenase accessory factor